MSRTYNTIYIKYIHGWLPEWYKWCIMSPLNSEVNRKGQIVIITLLPAVGNTRLIALDGSTQDGYKAQLGAGYMWNICTCSGLVVAQVAKSNQIVNALSKWLVSK